MIKIRFKLKNDNILKEYITKNNLTYYIDTMGCKMNENDSEKYRGILEALGLKQGTQESANIIIFNTCCVRENAENTLFGRLGYLKSKKLKHKDMYLIVVGCMSQQKHILEKIKKSYPYTDIVMGTHGMDKLEDKLYNVIINKQKQYEYIESEGEVVENIPIVNEDKYKANVSIIYGCNNFCSYCIVPYVRGRERSRKKNDILEDVRKLAKQGYKEITLLGQNVNSYGNDLAEEYTFSELLKDIETIESIEIIRFISPHPKDFKDELIETIANSKKISRQIHLPLQSGSTKILKQMNRKYTKEDYLRIVEKLKNADKNISISTDIIVGFPGETNEDFEETLDVQKKVSFDQMFMYIYSKRVGTKACNMEDNTSYADKVNRLETLKKLHENMLPENNKKYLNNVFDVLVEGKSKNNDNLYTGRTTQNKLVIFDATKEDVGNIRKVKILTDHLWYFKGEILRGEK